MKKNNHCADRKVPVRCFFLLLSLVICCFGTGCYLGAALGNDPLTACIQGISLRTGTSYGTAMTIVNGAACLVALIFDRSLIHIGTLLSFVLGGPVSDLCISMITYLLGPEPSLVLRVWTLLCGIICVGFGVGLYQAAHLGVSPLDAINQIIAAKLQVPIQWERVAYDALLFLAALFLGGSISFGTALSVLLVGPIMGHTFHRFSQIINR